MDRVPVSHRSSTAATDRVARAIDRVATAKGIGDIDG